MFLVQHLCIVKIGKRDEYNLRLKNSVLIDMSIRETLPIYIYAIYSNE